MGDTSIVKCFNKCWANLGKSKKCQFSLCATKRLNLVSKYKGKQLWFVSYKQGNLLKKGLPPSAFVKHGLILNFTDSHNNKTPDLKSIKINTGIDSGTTSEFVSLQKLYQLPLSHLNCSKL